MITFSGQSLTDLARRHYEGYEPSAPIRDEYCRLANGPGLLRQLFGRLSGTRIYVADASHDLIYAVQQGLLAAAGQAELSALSPVLSPLVFQVLVLDEMTDRLPRLPLDKRPGFAAHLQRDAQVWLQRVHPERLLNPLATAQWHRLDLGTCRPSV